MKRLNFTLVLIFFSFSVVAQGTTQQEYTYMKKSLFPDLADGRDIKRGYYTEEMQNVRGGSIDVDFIKLMREKDSTIAGIIIKTSSSEFMGSGVSYWVLPAGNTSTVVSYGWDEWKKDVMAMTSGIRYCVLTWMGQNYSQLLSWHNKQVQ